MDQGLLSVVLIQNSSLLTTGGASSSFGMNSSTFGMSNGNSSSFGMSNGSSSSFGMSNGGGSAPPPPPSGGRGPQVKIFGIPADTNREALKDHFASAGKLLRGTLLNENIFSKFGVWCVCMCLWACNTVLTPISYHQALPDGLIAKGILNRCRE